MNSRFKFVQSVDPQPISKNTVKSKFSKLTLATTKFVANTTCMTTTTTKTTTTTTTMDVLQVPTIEIEATPPVCAQKPNILLYESTTIENQSDILTDDDTDSVGSSIDSKEIESGLKETSQLTTQDTVANVDRIDTQMQNLSFLSPSEREHLTVKSNDRVQNMSRQFDQLDLQNDNDNDNQNDQSQGNIQKSEASIQTLSSDDTFNQEDDSPDKTEEKIDSDDVIVLSDSETEEASPESEPKERNVSEEPPFKPTNATSNDAAMYNLSSIDNSTMQRVNNFFDNAPFINPIDDSFNTSHASRTAQEDVFVPETTDEESIDEKSVIETSIHDADQPQESQHEQHQNDDVAPDQQEFSDNNIIVDIPVIKSTSDQPRQVIRSQSGVRLTASRSSPIIKTSSGVFDPDYIKHISSNLNLKTPSSIRVNSSNGQLNIAAKININIQIVEDSSEESSEDNRPKRKSQAIQSSEDQHDSYGYQSARSSHSDEAIPKTSSSTSPRGSGKFQTPTANNKLNSKDTPNKTPSTVNKLKQFEFVPPKSMTKEKHPDENKENEKDEAKSPNQSIETESSDKSDGFKVDKNIPISPRNQRLLYKVYGDAWKTPEVIKSYSAVKGKAVDRAATNATPSVFKKDRYSKGFDLFKQKIKTNLNSTRLEDHDEISIIEQPRKQKTPEKVSKTPRSKVKAASSVKKMREAESSPSVFTKKKPSPKSTKKKPATPADDSSIITPRPRRNVIRKPILDSEDESDKENDSDISDSSSFVDSDILTDDDSESEDEQIAKPKSVRKNVPGRSTSKRPPRKNGLVYLDLSSEEIAQVDENHHANVSEEDLANITRKFLETDLNDEEKPKKKTGRKLFTQQYDDIEEETEFEEPKIVKKKPLEEQSLDIEIPRFTHKLFDSKTFGSPSINKTPNMKGELRHADLKTPQTTSKILTERKTPFGSARSKLDSPPKTFETYGFLRSLDVQASMMLCHPEAKKYRENFKANKEELTNILYKMYNERVFGGKLDVDIVWNKKLITTAGRFHGKKMPIKAGGKNHHIELSEKVLTSADRLRCTLIHELCHAATWIFNNERGHGQRWKLWAKRSNEVFPELPKISVCHNYDIEYKYTYKCDMCHAKSYSHSKSKKVENIRCSYCHGMISIFLNKRKNGKVIMEPVREATGFAKFVKEKYKDFKKPGVKHAEVMRLISSQYAMLSQEEKKKY